MAYKLTGKYADEYCRKYPDMNDMALGRLLNKHFPEIYTGVEHARAMVRKVRGHTGALQRNTRKDKSNFKPLTYDSTPPKLPASRIQSKNVFTLPASIKKVLFLTDLHIPYQDNKAVESAVKYGKCQNIDCVYINGDLMDLTRASTHEQLAGKASIDEELEAAKEFLQYLRGQFPKAIIYFIPGNHDIRIERLLMRKAPELIGITEWRLDVLLHLGEPDKNVIFIPYGSKVYFGKLLVEHGDKMKGTGGVNPARTLALKFKRHTICGHFHRTSEAMSKIYDGEATVCYSVACLTDLEPDFMPVNEHNLGFAIIEMLPKGEFIVHNKKISNGKVF